MLSSYLRQNSLPVCNVVLKKLMNLNELVLHLFHNIFKYFSSLSNPYHSTYFCTSVIEVEINLPYVFPLLSSCILLCQICLLPAVSLSLYPSWYHWHHLPHLLSPNWIFAQVATAALTELYMLTIIVRIIFSTSKFWCPKYSNTLFF